jgi:hypothetical protein
VSPGPQHDILAVEPNQLGNPQAGLDRDQKKGPIATPEPGGPIRNREQCADLFLVEEFDWFSYVTFIGHRQDPLAMQGMCGIL